MKRDDKAAIRLGIECITFVRNKRFAVGANSWKAGMKIDSFEKDYKSFMKYTKRIQTLEKMLAQESMDL